MERDGVLLFYTHNSLSFFWGGGLMSECILWLSFAQQRVVKRDREKNVFIGILMSVAVVTERIGRKQLQIRNSSL
jgi:hypothetical protein